MLRRCPECRAIYLKEYPKKNREKLLKRRRKWQDKNREKLNRQAKELRAKDPEKSRRIGAEQRKKNPERSVWDNMRYRCIDPNNEHYDAYGARGITICDWWLGKHGFKHFLEDMGRRPTPKHTIERVNNDLGYSKDNCIWETHANQQRNTRRNVWIEHDGDVLCLTDWAVRAGLKPSQLSSRLRHGWSMETALSTPIKLYRPRSANIA